jgi:hypothetical protein
MQERERIVVHCDKAWRIEDWHSSSEIVAVEISAKNEA